MWNLPVAQFKQRYPDKTMKRIIILTFAFLCLITLPVLYAQDDAAVPAPADTVMEKTDSPAIDTPSEPVREQNAEKPRKKSSPVTTQSREVKPASQSYDEPAPAGDTTGIIGITEGDFKYERIPGITIKKPAQLSGPDIVQQPVPGVGGISALSSDMKNNLMRGGIVLLIFVLFIFYRSRTGRRRRRY